MKKNIRTKLNDLDKLFECECAQRTDTIEFAFINPNSSAQRTDTIEFACMKYYWLALAVLFI